MMKLGILQQPFDMACNLLGRLVTRYLKMPLKLTGSLCFDLTAYGTQNCLNLCRNHSSGYKRKTKKNWRTYSTTWLMYRGSASMAVHSDWIASLSPFSLAVWIKDVLTASYFKGGNACSRTASWRAVDLVSDRRVTATGEKHDPVSFPDELRIAVLVLGISEETETDRLCITWLGARLAAQLEARLWGRLLVLDIRLWPLRLIVRLADRPLSSMPI